MTTLATAAYALDAGGSHTVVRTRQGDGSERTWDEPSCAIATVGQGRAIQHLRRILGGVRAELSDAAVLRGCIASSSYPVAAEAPPPEPLVRTIVASGCTGQVVLVNDVVPLLWSNHLAGCGVIVNSGTGSVVIGRSRSGQLLKLGGHEHILSDQGSAYSVAREGLRAATRAVDGLGPGTILLARAEAFYGRSAPALGRWLAELQRARFEVARFAAEVFAAEEEGDAVAGAIVAAEAEALSQAALLAVSRLGLGDSPAVGLSGGVMCGSPRFRTLVVDCLTRGGLRPRTAVLDSTELTLAFVDRAEENGPQLLAEVGGLHLTVV
ncbi:MAG TPA: BadF/BadG/BcrA/BcrD ATPase family protein [Streptosporangiaceae bacterium]